MQNMPVQKLFYEKIYDLRLNIDKTFALVRVSCAHTFNKSSHIPIHVYAHALSHAHI